MNIQWTNFTTMNPVTTKEIIILFILHHPSICCLYYTYVYTVQFHVLHVFLCHAMLYILGVFSSPDMGTVHRSLCHAMLYILGGFFQPRYVLCTVHRSLCHAMLYILGVFSSPDMFYVQFIEVIVMLCYIYGAFFQPRYVLCTVHRSFSYVMALINKAHFQFKTSFVFFPFLSHFTYIASHPLFVISHFGAITQIIQNKNRFNAVSFNI